MIIHARTTPKDFTEFLYRTLQDAGFPTQVLDCVGELQGLINMENEIYDLAEEIETRDETITELRERLRRALSRKRKLK